MPLAIRSSDFPSVRVAFYVGSLASSQHVFGNAASCQSCMCSSSSTEEGCVVRLKRVIMIMVMIHTVAGVAEG